MADQDQILTLRETAARLRLSESRVRQLIEEGILPTAQVIRPRGKHLIHERDVERLLEPTR